MFTQDRVNVLDDLCVRRERELRRALSHEERRLLSILKDSNGTPVTLADMRAAGLANPATLIYELTLAGHTLDRVYMNDAVHRRQVAGFRIRDPEPPEPVRKRWLDWRPGAVPGAR